jgi:hypothetical protein
MYRFHWTIIRQRPYNFTKTVILTTDPLLLLGSITVSIMRYWCNGIVIWISCVIKFWNYVELLGNVAAPSSFWAPFRVDILRQFCNRSSLSFLLASCFIIGLHINLEDGGVSSLETSIKLHPRIYCPLVYTGCIKLTFFFEYEYTHIKREVSLPHPVPSSAGYGSLCLMELIKNSCP